MIIEKIMPQPGRSPVFGIFLLIQAKVPDDLDTANSPFSVGTHAMAKG
jgi:hypothetical protein